jgi:hypothetical protein
MSDNVGGTNLISLTVENWGTWDVDASNSALRPLLEGRALFLILWACLCFPPILINLITNTEQKQWIQRHKSLVYHK